MHLSYEHQYLQKHPFYHNTAFLFYLLEDFSKSYVNNDYDFD